MSGSLRWARVARGGGAEATRLTATDGVPVLHPRLNAAATHVAWTSTRDGTGALGRGAPREAYAASVDGGPVTRLTYWGDRFATVRGWVGGGGDGAAGDDEILVLSRTGLPLGMKTWAYAVPLRGPARRLDYGPVGDVAVRDGAVLVGSPMNFEPLDPAEWKRYRGGAGGKVWYSPDGARYERILADVGENLVNPMFVGTRVAFLSDHEGTGALYSACPTVRTCDVTPSSVSTTPGTPRPTADGSSTSAPASSGCWSRWTPSRSAWTSASAGTAPSARPIRCRRRTSSARSPWTLPARRSRPRCGDRALAADRGRGRSGPAGRAGRARPAARRRPRPGHRRLRVGRGRRGGPGRAPGRRLGGPADRARRVRPDPGAGGVAGRESGRRGVRRRPPADRGAGGRAGRQRDRAQHARGSRGPGVLPGLGAGWPGPSRGVRDAAPRRSGWPGWPTAPSPT